MESVSCSGVGVTVGVEDELDTADHTHELVYCYFLGKCFCDLIFGSGHNCFNKVKHCLDRVSVFTVLHNCTDYPPHLRDMNWLTNDILLHLLHRLLKELSLFLDESLLLLAIVFYPVSTPSFSIIVT